MSDNKEDKYIYMSEEYIQELTQKANDMEYWRGRVHGMEYVIDSLEKTFKGGEE